jgi:hypothetical protein
MVTYPLINIIAYAFLKTKSKWNKMTFSEIYKILSFEKTKLINFLNYVHKK